MSIPMPQPRIPGMPNGASNGRRSSFGRWLKRISLGLIFLMILLYLAGRLSEPVRSILAKTPGVGTLFQSPVWTETWLKSSAKTPATGQTAAGGQADTTALTPELSAQNSQQAAAQKALDQKEQELKVREDGLNQRQQAVEARENQLKKVEANLSQVEVIRAMKPTAVTELFDKLTDTEAIAILRYMENDEIAQILSNLDASRRATLFRQLGALKQAPSTGN